MKKTLLAVALASSLTSFGAVAADKAPEPDFSLSANIGVVSDYKFRGMSQTDQGAAIQGGVDLSHKSGAYLGTWASNVSDWTSIGGKNTEVDVYFGYRFDVPYLKGLGADLGYITYNYPGNNSPTNQNTQEIYLGLSYGMFGYKHSVTTGNWFGFCENSGGSTYQDVSLTHPISDQISVSAHYGIQDVQCATDYDFKDYKLGVTYDYGSGVSLGVSYVKAVGVNNEGSYTSNGKKLYEDNVVFSILKTF